MLRRKFKCIAESLFLLSRSLRVLNYLLVIVYAVLFDYKEELKPSTLASEISVKTRVLRILDMDGWAIDSRAVLKFERYNLFVQNTEWGQIKYQRYASLVEGSFTSSACTLTDGLGKAHREEGEQKLATRVKEKMYKPRLPIEAGNC